jgi:hypothetical protein
MSARHWAAAVSAAAAAAVVGFLLLVGNSDDSPYSFQDTLPRMVSDFGADARVADIQVDGEAGEIRYEIMASHGLVHVRDYRLSYVQLQHTGRTHYRHVVNSVRDATAVDLRNARVRLGDIPSGVVDQLFARLRFSQSAASATLEGETWTLQTDARLFDRYEARFDGSGLHQTRSRASLLPPPGSGQPKTATSTHTNQQPTDTIPSGATPGMIRADRLLACVHRAGGDIAKLTACQRRFTP